MKLVRKENGKGEKKWIGKSRRKKEMGRGEGRCII